MKRGYYRTSGHTAITSSTHRLDITKQGRVFNTTYAKERELAQPVEKLRVQLYVARKQARSPHPAIWTQTRSRQSRV